MSSSFALRLAIDTPISLRGLLHLDGLLGALLTARGGQLGDIPLERHIGIWQGSVGILETGPFGAVGSTNVRIKHVDPHGVPNGIMDNLKPGQRRIAPMHPMRNALTAYPCREGIRAVWFVARGDRVETLDLLSDARNLGAMGRTGWGRVTDVAAFDVHDEAMTGLVLESSSPARTIALDSWERLGLGRPEGAVVSLQRDSPPYWSGDQVPCISPTQEALIGTESEITAKVGVRR